MAKLTNEQVEAVKRWVGEGANLNGIQDRLKTEHDLGLTYLDIRLMMAELGLKIQEKPKEAPPKELPSASSAPQSAADETFAEEPAEFAPTEAGVGSAKVTVTVTVDAIAIPGMLASGKATFSDGKSAAWYLDELGRLGMKASEPGYKPPPGDVPVFQRELDLALKRAGF
jgi:hypothetical protein